MTFKNHFFELLYRPLDMCRRVVNVSGDAMFAMLVANSMDKLHEPKMKNWDDNYGKKD